MLLKLSQEIMKLEGVRDLRKRLDPATSQDFCCAVQVDSESLADYVCCLEKAFCVAFGRE